MTMLKTMIMTIVLLNIMLFFAYPASFGEDTKNTGAIDSLSQFGYNYNTSNNLTITTNSSGTGNITEDMYGVSSGEGATTSDTGTDWNNIRMVKNSLFWFSSLMFAPVTILSADASTPAMLVALVTALYGLIYIFGLLHIVTGRF